MQLPQRMYYSLLSSAYSFWYLFIGITSHFDSSNPTFLCSMICRKLTHNHTFVYTQERSTYPPDISHWQMWREHIICETHHYTGDWKLFDNVIVCCRAIPAVSMWYCEYCFYNRNTFIKSVGTLNQFIAYCAVVYFVCDIL